jgi:hypothetical protein
MDDHQIHAIYALYSKIEDMFCPLRLNLRPTYKPNPYPMALSSFTVGVGFVPVRVGCQWADAWPPIPRIVTVILRN